MRKQALITLLSGTMLAGTALAQQSPMPRTDPQTPTRTETQWRSDSNSTAAALPPGTTAKELNDQEDERSILASTVNAAVTKKGLDNVAGYLVTPDKKRIAEGVKETDTALDGRIDQIQKTWKAKYGEDLKLDADKVLKNFVVIREGEVTDPETAKMHWPVQAAASRSNSSSSDMNDSAMNKSPSSAEYLDKGRNIAIVTVPADKDKPALNVSLLHEMPDRWRIDIPDSITGRQIHDNLLACLTKFGDSIDQWPADSKQASEMLARDVLMAIYAVPAKSGNMGQASVNP